MHEVTLFAGPSAYGLVTPPPLFDGMRRLPPVRRGDIDKLLVESATPGAIVVCDGVFGGEPAVSHAELCRALDAGWRVWGVSSIGAIRAFELRSEGMLGSGYVYSQFLRFADFPDDEMCLLHSPAEPYFPISEPLVNLRYALEKKKAELGISDVAEARLLSTLRELWFGDRTTATIREVMLGSAGIVEGSADALLDWMKLHRVKTIDLADLLARHPWRY